MSGTVHIILPVKTMAGQAALCLLSITNQLLPGDRITVVDDGSEDNIAEVADHFGADVLRVDGPYGPYFARHQAAVASESDYLVFVDARCRAKPGWVDAHRTLLATSGVAMSCTGMWTRTGPTVAQRVSSFYQPFALTGKIGVNGWPDFFPTANLGVQRHSYRSIGGFRKMRSGSDADLCWRIQNADLGSLRADSRTLMEWEPRVDWTSTREQWTRYAQSTVYLEGIYPELANRVDKSGGLIDSLRKLSALWALEPAVALGALGLHNAYRRAYRRAKAEQVVVVAPDLYGWSVSDSEQTAAAVGEV